MQDKSFFTRSIAILLAVSALGTASPTGIHAQGLQTTPLSVTTSYLANTTLRGGVEPGRIEPSAQRYMMNYFSGIAVSPDAYVFGTTTWEEGIQRTGVYKNGDNMLDRPNEYSGTAVCATQSHLLIGLEGGRAVRIFKRTPGQAVDGQSGRAPGTAREIAVGETTEYISGVALDEKQDRMYVSFSTSGRVKIFKFSDGADLGGFDLPRAGRITLDGDGNLWVVQNVKAPQLELLPSTVSGSEAIGGHPIEHLRDADKDNLYRTSEKNGYAMLDLETPKPVSRVHIKGSEADSVGWKLQGATDAHGPWTDIHTVKYYIHVWPEEWITVNPKTPFRYLRFAGNDKGLSLGLFEAWTLGAAQNGAVLKYSPDGEKLPATIAIASPSAVAWDGKNQRLLVSDNGPNQQVMAYKTNGAKPAIDTTFATRGVLGKKGGVFAGTPDEAGTIGPERFDEIRGVGVDAAGNVYVGSCGPIPSQTRLEAYTPAGKLIWTMAGLAFEDMGLPDPADETSVYSGTNRYAMDYTQLAGNEWTHAATTVNMRKFDDQFRSGFSQILQNVVRIDGQPFLIVGNERTGLASIYRFDKARFGETAIPCAMFMNTNSAIAWPANQPAGFARMLWADKNGDGDYQADEFSRDHSPEIDAGTRGLNFDIFTSAHSFDDEGNFWYAPGQGGFDVLKKIAVSPKLDKYGCPSWSWDSPKNITFKLPAPFEAEGRQMGSTTYDTANKILYVTGFNADNPNTTGRNAPFGRVLARYRVEGDKLVLTNQLDLPYDVDIGDGPHDIPYAISMAGEYLFIGYWNSQSVRIYRKDDLSFVGQYKLGRQTALTILDGNAAVRAFKRPKVNEYLIFQSNYIGNSTLLIRWKPDVTRAPAVPAEFKVQDNGASVELAWQASPDAVGYAIERRDNTLNGWGKWKEIGRVKDGAGTGYSDTTSLPGSTAAYRVRAYNMGKGGGASDYTQSVFLTPGAKP